MGERKAGDPLPQQAGVYVYSKPTCIGMCYRFRGFCGHLDDRLPWEIESAYVVGRGAFWDIGDPGIDDDPRTPVPPGPVRLNSFDYTPLAAEKR
jgi:hypothetical protein